MDKSLNSSYLFFKIVDNSEDEEATTVTGSSFNMKVTDTDILDDLKDDENKLFLSNK